MAIIQFDTTPTSDTLQILTVLPQTEEIGSAIHYHCNSKSRCEWDFLNEVFYHYLNLNYSSLLEVVTPDFDFELPPLSETYDIPCIVNEDEFLCEQGKCQAASFSTDSQTWEGSCLSRSDFDLSIYKLEILTRYNDGVIPRFDSSFIYQCYWNICNSFEMVEQIRTVVKTEYEVQLLNLISTTTAPAVTNSSVISSTTTRMNNGCTHIDIGYHILFLLILSSSMTFFSKFCIN
jgi:hypothetical protein